MISQQCGKSVELKTLPLFKVFMSDYASVRVAEVLESGYIGQGPQVEKFEEEFAAFIGSDRKPLSMNSCTSAITLALHMCGVGPGSTVLATPMTCSASVLPVLNLHANIHWVDTVPNSGLIDPDDLAIQIRRLKNIGAGPVLDAIIAVDWGGHKCDYDALKQFGIPVIQDVAHSINALPGGDWVCWSLQAIKHLTTGDGGFLLPPEDQYKRAKLLRWYGLDRESSADFRCAQSISEAGWKFQMNDIAASIGRANLKHLDWILERHKTNAARLTALIDHPKIELPNLDGDFWLYTVLVRSDRDSFMTHMKDHGIAVSQVHRRNDEHPCFARYKRPLPGVDAFASRQCSIPVGWWIDDQDIDRIAQTVNEWRG